MLSWPWLEIAGLLVAAVALGIAWLANSHSKHANKVAEQANELAEQSVRVSKLPSVERLHEEFRTLVPKLRKSPSGRVRQLEQLAQSARLISSDSLGPPFDRLRDALGEVASRFDPRRRGANDPVGSERWAALNESIDGVFQAFEEFINR